MASLPQEGSPPPSIKQGVRVVADPRSSVEDVLLAVGDVVGHINILYGSRMNKAVVAFLREEKMVHSLVEQGIVLEDQYVPVSPLFVPSTRVTVSGVPPFIPNQLLENQLTRFGKFSGGFREIKLNCKNDKLQHVQSLRRQAFMYLNDPEQTLEVSFKVKYGDGYYTLYASSGSIKCFECGDVGHKRLACPHREQPARSGGSAERRGAAAAPAAAPRAAPWGAPRPRPESAGPESPGGSGSEWPTPGTSVPTGARVGAPTPGADAAPEPQAETTEVEEVEAVSSSPPQGKNNKRKLQDDKEINTDKKNKETHTVDDNGLIETETHTEQTDTPSTHTHTHAPHTDTPSTHTHTHTHPTLTPPAHTHIHTHPTLTPPAHTHTHLTLTPVT